MKKYVHEVCLDENYILGYRAGCIQMQSNEYILSMYYQNPCEYVPADVYALILKYDI